MTGRFAPSPTGELHVGNLRTALVAWLQARSTGQRFVLRIDDLDPLVCRPDWAETQRRDLAAIGIDWDGAPLPQSTRRAAYDEAIGQLDRAGLVYRCYCTRAEIAAAAAAPNSAVLPGAYPGTCRNLSATKLSQLAQSRPPALRLRAGVDIGEFQDLVLGLVSAPIDDVVLRRNDGVAAYNLATVVDDAYQGISEVIRGDDLAPSTPRQIHLANLLGGATPRFGHVPLVIGPDGERLAKRHGAVSLQRLAARGTSARQVVGLLAASLGLADDGELTSAAELVDQFSIERLPREPWVFEPGH
jgi:glutamyl-tRNA synthetase